ncbi:MAG: DUF1559 domain-containing protein [Planctomycetaceae bacterium]|nr:DUF1559 domain-containing protein [Planctomycetaceae bacterium]
MYGITESQLRSSRRSSVQGFTILELLTVMGIIAVLVILILPAVGSAREAARRMQCVNNLKQVGIALHQYHDTYASFPSGLQWESSQKSAYGWSVGLLPFLEQPDLYHQVHRDYPLSHDSNEAARKQTLPMLLCPSDITVPQFTLYSDESAFAPGKALIELPTASYFGVFGVSEPDEADLSSHHRGEGTFLESRAVRLAELLNGTSHTVIVGERTMARVPSTWLGVDGRGEDAACRLLGNTFTAPNCRPCDECEFASRHPGGANFLWADGHVSLVSETIDQDVYRKMGCRSDF